MQGLNVKYPEQQIAIIIIINFPPITYEVRLMVFVRGLPR